MILAELLEGAVAPAAIPPALAAREITGLECRPEHVTPGHLFFAIDEYLRYNIWCHGADFIDEARARGATAVVCRPEDAVPANLPAIRVDNPRVAFGRAARNFHGAPDQTLPVIGVTGTNGKTTTVRLIEHLFAKVGGGGASAGTLGIFLNGEKVGGSDYTTDLAHENYRRLRTLAEAGARGIAMEVSSHALALERVAGIRFAAAVVTNVTRDHLDFHQTEDAYRAAKLRLVEMLPATAPAILNRDMDGFPVFAAAANPSPVLSYGIGKGADVFASDIQCRLDGTRFRIDGRFGGHEVRTRLVGRFQIHNTLAAFSAAAALGLAPEALADALADFRPAPGRMETVSMPRGVTAVVDYAHNPDGLRNLLENCLDLDARRVLLVFGCGGDRDRGKRPIMGSIATTLAHHSWITSDNPRTEDPEAILDDIVAGCAASAAYTTIVDRAEAIRAAYTAAQPGDLLVIAGKGHEDYLLIGHEKIPYSDFRVLADCAGA